MHSAHEFLANLAMVLCVAAVTTVVFQFLKQPVVLGYLLAGMIVGPHIPIPLVADMDVVKTLSELGVILLMFSLGLEFSLGKLLAVGPRALVIACVECGLMGWLGWSLAWLVGWTPLECVYAGAMVAISSTTIIVRAFGDQQITGNRRDLVLGILIVEDLIAILLLTLLTTLSSGEKIDAASILRSAGGLLLFLVGLVGVGMLVLPRITRKVVALGQSETVVVGAVGLSFAFALLAWSFGYSVALGAFIGGALVAESGEGHTVEHLIRPVKDLFGAIFFVSVGMLIEPATIAANWGVVLLLILVVVVGKVVGVSLGSVLTGHSVRDSVQAGMSLAQIGEFSFMIASLGLALSATGDHLYPIAVAVSAVTTLTTPALIKRSGQLANFVDRQLPRPLQTFVAVYGAWLEQLTTGPAIPSRWAPIRRAMLLIVADALLVWGVLVLAPIVGAYLEPSLQLASQRWEPGHHVLVALGWVAVLALQAPFMLGIVRQIRFIAGQLVRATFASDQTDELGAPTSPQRLLLVTFELVAALAVGLPLLAVCQPLVPWFPGATALLLVVLVLGLDFWRRAREWQEAVAAGSERLLAVIAQARGEPADVSPTQTSAGWEPGEYSQLSLDGSHPAVGQSLAQLNLRAVSGAMVVCIHREGAPRMVPTGSETLRVGDTLTLAGTEAARASAVWLLGGGAEASLKAGTTLTRGSA